MKLRTVFGIALLAFIFAFTGLVIFGFFGQSQQTATAFTAGFFALFLFTLGTVYIAYSAKLEGAVQHMLVIISVLAVSLSFALAVSSLKDGYLNAQSNLVTSQLLQNDIVSLQDNNTQYLNSINYMNVVLKELDNNISQLGHEITFQEMLDAQIQQASLAQQQVQEPVQPPVQPAPAVQQTQPVAQPVTQPASTPTTQPVRQRRSRGNDD